MSSLKSLPNRLTIARMVMAPIITLMIFFLPINILWVRLIIAVLFILASLTDFLDGYLARMLGSQSDFGSCFDSIADKLLVISVLFMLSSVNYADTLPSVIISAREIVISGLRQFLATKNIKMTTTISAKVKAALQFISISFIIVFGKKPSIDIGNLLLWISAFLSIWTMVEYIKSVKKHISY